MAHPNIKFTLLSEVDFVSLREKLILKAINGSNMPSTFGEKVYTGNTPTNEECFLFEYHENEKQAASFLICSGGTKVVYHTTSRSSQQTLQSLIRGNITKFCLQEQGRFCLHASAMCVNNKVVLFIGRKGAGKSTLAAYFHLKGHEIWCDDYVLMESNNEKFYAFQGETSVKINPDIVSTLNIPETRLQNVFELPEDWQKSPESDFLTQKYYFNQQEHKSQISPRQIEAVFFLNQRVQDPKELITNIKIADAYAILLQEILLPGLNSKKYLKHYFQSSMHLLKAVPSFSVNSPDSILRINEVYNSIIQTLDSSMHEAHG